MSESASLKWRKKNIRALPTAELKTYARDYYRGLVYKFAKNTAAAELKRRSKKTASGKRKKVRRPRRQYDMFANFRI